MKVSTELTLEILADVEHDYIDTDLGVNDLGLQVQDFQVFIDGKPINDEFGDDFLNRIHELILREASQ